MCACVEMLPTAVEMKRYGRKKVKINKSKLEF